MIQSKIDPVVEPDPSDSESLRDEKSRRQRSFPPPHPYAISGETLNLFGGNYPTGTAEQGEKSILDWEPAMI